VETISYIIGYLGVGVTLGFFDYGVWALVYASLAQSFVFLVVSYLMVRHNILFLFGWKYYKLLFSYGSRSSLIGFTEFIGGELDTMIIGKMLGTKSLGYYNRGFMLINLPIYHMTTSISKVLFPSFSRIQADLEKLGKVYLSSITIVASMLIPVGVGIAIGADEIVFVMLGEKWQPSIPILQILGLGLSVGFINVFAGIVCDATANLSKKIKLTSSFIIIQLLLFICFSPLGLIGFALAVAVGHFLKTAMYIVLMGKVLKLEAKEIFSRYFPGILNGLYVGLMLFLSKQFLLTLNLPSLIVLTALAIIGGIVLFSVIFVLPGKTLKDEIQGFLLKLDISPSKQGIYNRTMLSYMNYLNRR
jgi:lipopolysaccharide exporter